MSSRTRLAGRAATTLLLLVSAATPGGAASAARELDVARFVNSDAVSANPDRGFYRYTETHLTGNPADYQRLDPATLAALRDEEQITLIFRYFYLDGYPGRDSIDPAELDLIRADLRAVREAGAKIIIRFAYSSSSSQDAPPWRVLGHIRQLAPILNENADVVAALQAGFIGRWGEWYYSTSFTTDPSRPWILTEADWQARETVLRALMDAVVPTIPIQVRYPAIKQRLGISLSQEQADRIGIHNDCFLASADDYGTFASQQDRDWLTVISNSALVGGETCVLNQPRSDWQTASDELAKYHYTYLNSEFHEDVLASWGAGRKAAARRLGYRLQLTRASVPKLNRPGQKTRVRIHLRNNGYAAPVTMRPVQLILSSSAGTTVTPVPADTRTWAPGRDIALTAVFPAPAEGSYRLYLNLPDPAGALTTQRPLINGDSTNAAYAVRLDNIGVWDAARGWNDLHLSLRVTAP